MSKQCVARSFLDIPKTMNFKAALDGLRSAGSIQLFNSTSKARRYILQTFSNSVVPVPLVYHCFSALTSWYMELKSDFQASLDGFRRAGSTQLFNSKWKARRHILQTLYNSMAPVSLVFHYSSVSTSRFMELLTLTLAHYITFK